MSHQREDVVVERRCYWRPSRTRNNPQHPRSPYTNPHCGSCFTLSRTSVCLFALAVLSIVLASTVITLVVVQETASETLDWSVYLRTEEQQAEVAYMYATMIATNRTRVKEYVFTDAPCLDAPTCGAPGGCCSTRRRREADGLKRYNRKKRLTSYDNCCPTTFSWKTPDKVKNVNGNEKKLYHESDRRQHYVVHECQQVTSCKACECYQEYQIQAIVIEEGNSKAIDYLSVPSCCKCVFI